MLSGLDISHATFTTARNSLTRFMTDLRAIGWCAIPLLIPSLSYGVYLRHIVTNPTGDRTEGFSRAVTKVYTGNLRF